MRRQRTLHNMNGSLRHIVTKACDPSSTKSILVPGNGNSTLSVDLLTDYRESTITSGDFSSVVIQHMSEKYKEHRNLKWVVSDIRDEQNENSYDMIIEKGVIDAIVAVISGSIST